MKLLVIAVSVAACLAIQTNLPDPENIQPETAKLLSSNQSGDPNKDMYVIHAMVYQVGIITNRTEDDVNKTGLTGNQEAITFYHTNGSNLDLSQIPEPLVTNLTAQRLVGVAPTTVADIKPYGLSWANQQNMATGQSEPSKLGNLSEKRRSRDVSNEDYTDKNNDVFLFDENHPYLERLYKRSSELSNKGDEGSSVKIASGAAVIPREARVQSVAIPPLLALNNNFSEIPVPIPNTSVVHYAKINTLINHIP